jgi:hypothetical protein
MKLMQQELSAQRRIAMHRNRSAAVGRGRDATELGRLIKRQRDGCSKITAGDVLIRKRREVSLRAAAPEAIP